MSLVKMYEMQEVARAPSSPPPPVAPLVEMITCVCGALDDLVQVTGKLFIGQVGSDIN